MSTKKSKKYRSHHHPFLFQIPGQRKPFTICVKVKNATQNVTLRLTSEDVQRSIAENGVANTQTCSMATCAKRQADAFPHPVEGYIDWFYSRAYVVSKVSKKTGMPEECVVYRHQDDVAMLNDDPKYGQKKLLSELLLFGDRDIVLRPITAHSSGKSGKKKESGTKRSSRKKKSIPLKGANLRYAVAQLGGVAH